MYNDNLYNYIHNRMFTSNNNNYDNEMNGIEAMLRDRGIYHLLNDEDSNKYSFQNFLN